MPQPTAGCGTGPRVFFSSGHHAGPNGIALHIVNWRPEMLIVENTGEEPALPKITVEMILHIETKRISSVGISQHATWRIGFFWNQDKMDMVGHQAVGPDFDAVPGGVFAKEGKVMLAIPGLEKDFTPPISALGDVMRQSRNHYSGDPTHWRNEIR